MTGDAGLVEHELSHAEIVKRDQKCEDCADGGDDCGTCEKNFYSKSNEGGNSTAYCRFKGTPNNDVTEGK